jgi:hypothetical protein
MENSLYIVSRSGLTTTYCVFIILPVASFLRTCGRSSLSAHGAKSGVADIVHPLNDGEKYPADPEIRQHSLIFHDSRDFRDFLGREEPGPGAVPMKIRAVKLRQFACETVASLTAKAPRMHAERQRMILEACGQEREEETAFCARISPLSPRMLRSPPHLHCEGFRSRLNQGSCVCLFDKERQLSQNGGGFSLSAASGHDSISRIRH